mgnify:CR=1 FL=1
MKSVKQNIKLKSIVGLITLFVKVNNKTSTQDYQFSVCVLTGLINIEKKLRPLFLLFCSNKLLSFHPLLVHLSYFLMYNIIRTSWHEYIRIKVKAWLKSQVHNRIAKKERVVKYLLSSNIGGQKHTWRMAFTSAAEKILANPLPGLLGPRNCLLIS